MPDNNKDKQNHILSFFTPSSDQNAEFGYLEAMSIDGYYVFVVGSLSSHSITDLKSSLDFGLKQTLQSFNEIDMQVLDRMKASIYEAGDHLAEKLMASGEPVDDVDFSVGIFAFKDDIVYVWIDGNINARIYRNNDSILINADNTSQFYGSTYVVLGDIFGISFTNYIEESDEFFEDYVLEKKRPSYPSLYLDYQVDSGNYPGINATPTLTQEDDGTDVKDYIDDDLENEELYPVTKDVYSNTESINPELAETKFSSESDIQDKRGPDVIKKFLGPVKIIFFSINSFFLKLTSPLLDLVYKLVLRKNPHQLKRFQASTQKLQLQYLIIFLIFAVGIYFVFIRGGDTAATGGQQAKTSQTAKQDIDTEFNKLTQYYNASQVDNFNKSILSLRQKVNQAKSSGFEDNAYLDQVLSQSLEYEDSINKITAITKVDEFYDTSSIAGAEIVDFDIVGKEIFALDKANKQILKGIQATQKFEVFVEDSSFEDLSKIACTTGICYVLDDNKGLGVLSIKDKTLKPFSGLVNGGKDVKEMLIFTNRLYTLIPAEQKIMKYDRVGDGLSTPTQWNKDEGFGLDTEDFAIDGNVFELNNKGELRKFFGGKNDPSYSGLDKVTPPLGSKLQLAMTPARISTSPQNNRTYIADSQNSRIVVFDKSTDYRYSYAGSYKYRGTDKVPFKEFKDIILSADEKYMYILESNTVYKINVSAI
jgi:hypothetical protein